MKFQMYGREFKTIIDRIGGIVPKKTVLPILETIKITAYDKHVEFQATDTINYAAIEVYANVFENGEVRVSLSDLKKALAITDDLTITAKDGKLDIRSAKKSYELPCKDSYDDSWLQFPDTDNNNILLKQQEKNLVKHLSVINCTRATQQANTMMTSFFFDLINQKIVTLDGHRIGIANIHGMFSPNRWNFAVDGSVYNCLKSLSGKSKDDEKYIEVYADKKYVKFIGEDYTYVTKIVEGVFFDYKKIIDPCNNQSDYAYKLNPKELLKISKEYSKVITNDNRMPMIFYNENGNVATGIKMHDYKTSDIIESVESEYGMDAQWSVGVNPYFITDACEAFTNIAEVCGNYNSRNPIMIKDDIYEFLILPINITDNDIEFVKRQVA